MTNHATGAHTRRGPLEVGDKVQLTDPKGRLNTIVLTPGAVFHTHKGRLFHDDLIGRDDGLVVENTAGVPYQALRPTYEDFVLSMPRGAAIVYPKDAALVVTYADIFPGARVVESGVGSGALTLALLRAVGDSGYVHSIELREEFAEIAAGNVEDFFGGEHPAWKLSVGDLGATLPEAEAPGSVDRIVLDMLTPWEFLDACAEALAPGGIVIAYVATVPQLSRTVDKLVEMGCFTQPRSFESILRDWHAEGLAVRPEHRMVGHTGFLVMARRLAVGQEPLERKKRPQAATPKPEDTEAWESGEVTLHAIGQREGTPKKLRRMRREVGSRAKAEAQALQPEDVANGKTGKITGGDASGTDARGTMDGEE